MLEITTTSSKDLTGEDFASDKNVERFHSSRPTDIRETLDEVKRDHTRDHYTKYMMYEKLLEEMEVTVDYACKAKERHEPGTEAYYNAQRPHDKALETYENWMEWQDKILTVRVKHPLVHSLWHDLSR